MAETREATKPSDAAPKPLQVVFQGGGAKLCCLMAVCKVLKDYEQANRIRVTRAAGSSAGAIAATMLATHKSIDEYKAAIKLAANKFERTLNVGEFWGKFRVIIGHPYFGKSFKLENVFGELFGQEVAQSTVNGFRFPLELYFTDLYTLQSRTAPTTDTVAQALAKSCRFPFAFAGYSSGEQDVDGGLAMNLPVDSLYARSSENGEAIAVSFLGTHGHAKKGLIGYSEQLMSAAIQSGVARSEAILGSRNVFVIKTDIGTFEFGRALTEGLTTHFDLTAERFRSWLEGWLKVDPPLPPAPDVRPPEIIRPTLATFRLPPAVIRELHDIRREPKTRGKRLQSFETANLVPSRDWLEMRVA